MFGVAFRVTTRVILDHLVGRRQLPSLFGKPSSTLQPNPVPQSITYQNLFSQLRSPPDIFEAEKLHALLVVNGFFNSTSTDRALGSQLVNVYVDFGCLQEALVVFDKLPNKSSNLAWNAILRGFIDLGEFSKAVHFYHLMLTQGPVPDNFTNPLVLKACSGSNDIEQGRRVRDQILFDEIHRNLKRNVYVECAMIDMFAKCGSLNEARKVFDEMPRRDLASWSSMICGAVQSGELSEALCLFKRMRLEGLRPDSVIVAAVLPICSSLEDKQMGMVLQGCVIRSGFESDLFVSNALIDMYCKCGDTYEAHGIFCGMVFKDVVSWSSLIAGYAQNCQYRESIELYAEMKSEGLMTNAIIVATVLPGLAKLKLLKQGKEMHSFVLKQAFESDVVVGSALIDMYANCGSMVEAQHIFESMSDSGISLWNSMIVGCSLNGDFDLAVELFRRIQDSNLKPNSITLVSILPMCTKIGNLRLGKEIHGYATRSGLSAVNSVGNSIIDMYCKCGYLELGLKIFNQMVDKNIVTYNTTISAHGIHGRGHEAFTFFEQMKEARIRPNKVTFVALLSACSHSGLLDRGWFFYNSMIDDYHIPPDTEHYSCMVDLLGRAGHLQDACNFIRSMPVEPDIDVLGTLLGASRVHNKIELAELVKERILVKDQNDPGFFVLLSNIYASTNRWNDALKVRNIIRETGLVKKPASSWIQIGSSIHVFHARERMHPEFDKIQEMLDNLLSEMKNEGYVLYYYPSLFSHDPIGDHDESINFNVC
ncbi:hypothetical protein Ddye_017340 [Dipteronia dyeriana]|uniref:Pentatricopeptide repeat-containing protein n=1 Tax=Dipteronia dyeriana TaxID=168575 RepID=A0AAD9U925_9ROSI|nr:hypothetical protein Ddye_017340 [Dipteronia dyeriana]